jgi:hypothetical protein
MFGTLGAKSSGCQRGAGADADAGAGSRRLAPAGPTLKATGPHGLRALAVLRDDAV